MSNESQAPHWVERYRYWRISRYADVSAMLRRVDLVVSDIGVGLSQVASRSGTDLSALTDALARIPVYLNPPAHSPERRVFARALTGISAQDIERIVQRHFTRILDQALAAGGMDAATDLADVIAMGVMADLLDLPQEDVSLLNRLTTGVLALTNTAASLPLYQSVNAQAVQCIDYLLDVVRRRRAHPGDDAVSRMLSIVGEEDDDRYMAVRLFGLLVVGTETSATFLSHSVARLIEYPEEKTLLAAFPEKLDTGIEELLRLVSPARFSLRATRQPVEVGGVMVPAGQRMILDLYAANRDPAVFRRPDALDLENTVPHLSFSEGLHLCLGARYARIEGRVVVSGLLAAPPMRLLRPSSAVGSIDVLPRLQSLPIAFM